MLDTWDSPSLCMEESSKPGSLSPGERQHRKAMKESEKQEQALNHLALLPGNPLIPDMILNMTSSEERLGHGGTSHTRRYPHKHLFKAARRNATQQHCLRRGHCTQPVPQHLPGTVIWMMSSSSGSILICLMPPSSPEVPTRERQRKAIADRNQRCHICPPTRAGKPWQAMTSVPAEHPTAMRLRPSGPVATRP